METLPRAAYENISIENLPFLTPDDCRRVRATLFDLRPHWQARTPLVPFYTLGAASYLDADLGKPDGNEDHYRFRAAHFNPLLRQHFSWLYDRLGPFLARRLGAPTGFREGGGLPGFNILLAHRAFIKMTASIHVDWQYQNLDWSWAKRVGPKPISFTLAIALPREGSGINVWDIGEARVVSSTAGELEAAMQGTPRRRHAYVVGHITLHIGHVLHQVPAPENVHRGDERITLQGHGVLCDGRWHLFW